MEVSIFNKCMYYDGDSTIPEVIEAIRNGAVKELILELRELLILGKEKEYNALKKNLPGMTVSGTFRNGRKAENLHQYNGCIVIDVDKLTPALLLIANERAKQSPYTFASYISPSDAGIKIISKTNATPETHQFIYNKLKDYYAEWLNLFIDESGKDIPRLSLYSFDPDAYLNEQAETFNPKNLLHMEKIKQNQSPEALFQHCKRYTDKKKTYSEGNRNNYLHLLANNCNRKGLPQDQCLYFACNEFDLPSDEIKLTIESAYKNIREYNTDKKTTETESKNNIQIIEDYLNEKYSFRFNVVTGRMEFKPMGEFAFKPITDYIENSLFRELLKAGIRCNITKLRSILCSDFCPQFDPFINYFNALSAWDETTDHISELANTVKTTNQEFWLNCFKRWLVAMVGTAIDPKTINHTVIVFTGKQGVGKTTWMINLVPKQLRDYLFSGTINPDNKDTLIHLAECMLINLDELENLNKSEIGSLKEVITKNHIRIRRAYGHNNETIFRRASFCGSVNTAHFLNDSTGSRRFLCFEVTEINYQHTIDINLVLAQALHLFKSGFKHYFDKDEILAITENNEQYQMKSVEEELLLTYFSIPTSPHETKYLTTSQIASKIAEKTKTSANNGMVNALGKMLVKHKFAKTKKNGRQVYAVKELSYDEVEREASQHPIDITKESKLNESHLGINEPGDESEIPF